MKPGGETGLPNQIIRTYRRNREECGDECLAGPSDCQPRSARAELHFRKYSGGRGSNSLRRHHMEEAVPLCERGGEMDLRTVSAKWKSALNPS